MLRSRTASTAVFQLVCLLWSCCYCSAATLPHKAPTAQATRNVKIPQLRFAFEPNVGQERSDAEIVCDDGAETVLVRKGGFSVVRESDPADAAQQERSVKFGVSFEGANATTQLQLEEKQEGVSNYFRGSDEREWHAGVPRYSKVRYRELYPGIDLLLHFTEGRLEYDFDLAPGADPKLIKLRFTGDKRIAITSRGDLASGGTIFQHRPVAYQVIGSQKHSVPVLYRLRGDEARLNLGPYDRRKPVVIDPMIASVIAHIGRGFRDVLARGNSGALYIASEGDAWKVNLQTGTILYHTVFDGGGGALTEGIALDSSENAYIAGFAPQSAVGFFPIRNAAQPNSGGGFDGFVTKLDGNGGLVQSTWLGGNNIDQITGIAVDSSGAAYVTGFTQSPNFPSTAGTLSGVLDAFVTKFSPDGRSILWSRLLGGTGDDSGAAIALDSAGQVYVVGKTASPDFPITLDAFRPTSAPGFASKFSPTGALLYSTYFPSSATAVLIEPGGDWYIAGSAACGTLCLYRLQADGSRLLFTVSICGAASCDGFNFRASAEALALDSAGNIYVSGAAAVSFPLTSPAFGTFWDQSAIQPIGSEDAFVAEFSSDGQTRIFSTVFGFGARDDAAGLAVDPAGNIYLTSCECDISVSEIPLVGPQLLPPFPDNRAIGWVAELSPADTYPAPVLTQVLPAAAVAFTNPVIFVNGINFSPNAVIRLNGADLPTTFLAQNTLKAPIPQTATGGSASITVFNPPPGGGTSGSVAFTVTNVVPVATAVAPNILVAGSKGVMVTVTGSKFEPQSVVRFNGSDRATTYVSSTELQATLLDTDLAAGGLQQVSVFTPAPGGGASNNLNFTVSFVSVTPSATTATVAAGASTTMNVTIAPQLGNFTNPVTFSCSNLPQQATCSFSPATVTPNAGSATTSLTIATSARTGATNFGPGGEISVWATVLAFPTVGICLLPIRDPRRRRVLFSVGIVMLMTIAVSCGGGGGGSSTPAPAPKPVIGTPAGSYQVNINAQSGAYTQSSTITLVVQ